MNRIITSIAALVFCTFAFAQKKADPTFVQFTTDTQLIIVDETGGVTRFDIGTGSAIETYRTDADPKAKLVRVSLTPDRKFGAAWFRSNNLQIWEVEGGKLKTTIAKIRETDTFDHYVVFERDGGVFRYDVVTGSEEKLTGSSFKVSNDKRTLITLGGTSVTVYSQDPAPKTITLTLGPVNNGFTLGTVNTVFSPDGKFVAQRTDINSGEFKWVIFSTADGSQVAEKTEAVSGMNKFEYFGFTWKGVLMFNAQKAFAQPTDMPKIGSYSIADKASAENTIPPNDSEPGTWSHDGIVVIGPNVGAADKSWMLPADPNGKNTPATDACITPDASKLIICRKKSATLELYDLKDTEKVTQKTMFISMEYQKPKLLKTWPIP